MSEKEKQSYGKNRKVGMREKSRSGRRNVMKRVKGKNRAMEKRNGGAISVENLLLAAEYYKRGILSHNEFKNGFNNIHIEF